MGDAEPESPTANSVLLREVLTNWLLLVEATHTGVGEQCEEVGVLGVAVGDRVVTLSVVELVMILVVRRDGNLD